jgi:hypothetical protein
MKFIIIGSIILLEFISYICLFTTSNHERGIYPFLNDPDMTAWKNVIDTGVLYTTMIISVIGLFASLLLSFGYFFSLRLRVNHNKIFSLLFVGLIIASIFKILFLGHSFNELLQISFSLKPCDKDWLHLQCSISK